MLGGFFASRTHGRRPWTRLIPASTTLRPLTSPRGVSLVNHDNNQHGPDENLRLRNLWEGIDLLAAIMTMPRPPRL